MSTEVQASAVTQFQCVLCGYQISVTVNSETNPIYVACPEDGSIYQLMFTPVKGAA